jgi:type VI secretion system protein ImpE
MPQSPQDLYKAGQLGAAIQQLSEQVRDRPTDIELRSLLAEFLCVRGELERADTHFELLSKQVAPGAQVGVAWLRQLVRAEQWRQDFYVSGRAPAVLGTLETSPRLALEATIALREQRSADAATLLAESERVRPKPRGTLNGAAFDDLRDLDDLCASVLEVLTSTGKYYWVAWERVRAIEFSAPERPLDLIWRGCDIEVQDGPQGKVWIPAIYAGLPATSSDALRMGRATEWDETLPGIVRGRGLRTFLVGDDAKHVLELGTASIDACTSSAGAAQA